MTFIYRAGVSSRRLKTSFETMRPRSVRAIVLPVNWSKPAALRSSRAGEISLSGAVAELSTKFGEIDSSVEAEAEEEGTLRRPEVA